MQVQVHSSPQGHASSNLDKQTKIKIENDTPQMQQQLDSNRTQYEQSSQQSGATSHSVWRQKPKQFGLQVNIANKGLRQSQEKIMNQSAAQIEDSYKSMRTNYRVRTANNLGGHRNSEEIPFPPSSARNLGQRNDRNSSIKCILTGQQRQPDEDNFPGFQLYDTTAGTGLATSRGNIYNNKIKPHIKNMELFMKSPNPLPNKAQPSSDFTHRKQSQRKYKKHEAVTANSPNLVQSMLSGQTQESSQIHPSLMNSRMFKTATRGSDVFSSLINQRGDQPTQNQLEAQIQQQKLQILEMQNQMLLAKTYIESLPDAPNKPQFCQVTNTIVSNESTFQVPAMKLQPGVNQDIFIQDIMNELQKAKGDISVLRQTLIMKETKENKIIHENRVLQDKIKTYRAAAAYNHPTSELNEKLKSGLKSQVMRTRQQLAVSSFDTDASPSPPLSPSSTLQRTNESPERTKSLDGYHEVNNTVEFKKNQVQSFAEATSSIRAMLQAEDVPQLLTQARQEILKVFKAQTVDFLLMDKEFITLFKLQDGRCLKLLHSHFRFQIAVPDDVKIDDDYEGVPPKFKLLQDVMRGFCCQGKNCVWPVVSKDSNGQKINLMLIQIAHNGANKSQFNSFRDSRVILEISQVIAQIFTNLSIKRKVKEANERAIHVLNTFKHLLADRKHVSICKWIMDVFPKLFKFQSCSVLFMNNQSQELFRIQFIKNHQIQSEAMKKCYTKEFDSIVTFPLNIGLTGVVCSTRQSLFFNEGQRMGNFQDEIDNSGGQSTVSSLLLSPIISIDSELQGIIQLVNKLDGERITDHDVTEIEALMPALGEIFKTAEEVRQFQNVSCGVHYQLMNMKDSIFNNIKQLDDEKMKDINGSVNSMKTLVTDLISHKKQVIFSDKYMSKEIFQGIRDSKK